MKNSQPYRLPIPLILALPIWLILLVGSVMAHPIDISSSVLYLKDNHVEGKIVLPMAAVLRYFQGGGKQGMTAAQKKQEIFSYVDSHFQIQTESGQSLGWVTRAMSFRSVDDPEKMNLQIRFKSEILPPQGQIHLQNTLFFEKALTQKNLITLYAKGGIDKLISTVSEYRFLLRDSVQPQASATSTGTFVTIRMGIEHILLGFDHLIFLFCILLTVRKWRNLLLTITAFTVAHSLTLVLTALDILVFSPRLTESLIALSIVFVALENLICKNFDQRWKPTFILGLVHGIGFAFAFDLAGLQDWELLKSVLFFNFGVEFMRLKF